MPPKKRAAARERWQRSGGSGEAKSRAHRKKCLTSFIDTLSLRQQNAPLHDLQTPQYIRLGASKALATSSGR